MEQPAFNDFDLFRNLCAIPSSHRLYVHVWPRSSLSYHKSTRTPKRVRKKTQEREGPGPIYHSILCFYGKSIRCLFLTGGGRGLERECVIMTQDGADKSHTIQATLPHFLTSLFGDRLNLLENRSGSFIREPHCRVFPGPVGRQGLSHAAPFE